MPFSLRSQRYVRVALLAEGVDRNIRCGFFCCAGYVALLAEGVDRNTPQLMTDGATVVALLAEGVDRNDERNGTFENEKGRPPRGGRG